jgi:hypothetical protein
VTEPQPERLMGGKDLHKHEKDAKCGAGCVCVVCVGLYYFGQSVSSRSAVVSRSAWG